MDIVVKGRHQAVGDSFRSYAIDKLGKLERLDQKVIRIDVEVSKEHNPRQSSLCERVELTCLSKGPVIRAEARADDAYAALDLAFAKLGARLRRAADRRRVHHGNRTPTSLASATFATPSPNGAVPAAVGAEAPAPGTEPRPIEEAPIAVVPAGDEDAVAAVARPDSAPPLVVREKLHRAAPMSIEQALFEMEMVGHDFFLFSDAATGLPSVVYRRRGYDYGVIRLGQ